MRLNQKRWMFGLRTAVVFLAAGLLSLSTAMSALAVDDTIKQIERKLSSVKRNIPTSPDRAEKDYLEARAMLQELEKTDPGQTQLSVLKKNMEQLGEQLEKRLKRPIGESAPVVEKSAASPAPAAVATALPSAVSSRLKKIDQNLDAL